ncbi:Outer membrane protein OmpA [Candidatus Nitrotoga sp. HW29]|uniref:OmpA family protein n=1 Tax=Candidatus Nitrotoga sp. HW29 TaxID=2886963 RepID=UPI000E372B7C|nr:OmpA family protein [Candidatus Nitrotoga sp. HW29]RFC31696.1 MAG: Outer membrane protein OmpA [Candidatus Nitrotoga sp. SPKER]CAH1904623.1 Outer membrane protein OmpA [Candidatus Nitrotoga sp. HW29]
MIKRRVAVLILAIVSSTLLVGCNNLSREHPDRIVNVDPSIGYLDGKFRICRENCPKRTEKVLDDADYAVMQAPPVSIQQSEPPITLPVSIAIPANEHADIFIVQFEFGKSIPTSNGYKTIALLTKAAKQTAVAIELIGETDDIGTQKYNDKLASRRMNFVVRWLKSHGVNARISVEAKGGCCHPAPYDTTETALQEKRRVQAKVQQTIEKGGRTRK